MFKLSFIFAYSQDLVNNSYLFVDNVILTAIYFNAHNSCNWENEWPPSVVNPQNGLSGSLLFFACFRKTSEARLFFTCFQCAIFVIVLDFGVFISTFSGAPIVIHRQVLYFILITGSAAAWSWAISPDLLHELTHLWQTHGADVNSLKLQFAGTNSSRTRLWFELHERLNYTSYN